MTNPVSLASFYCTKDVLVFLGTVLNFFLFYTITHLHVVSKIKCVALYLHAPVYPHDSVRNQGTTVLCGTSL